MRLLVIANNFPTPTLPADGMFVLRQLLALRRLGVEAHVVRPLPWAPPLQRKWRSLRDTPARYEIENFRVSAPRFLILRNGRGTEWIGSQLRPMIRRLIKRERPDVVHVHGVLHSGLIALGIGIPFVLTAHGSDAYDLPWRSPTLTRCAQRVVREAAACVGVSHFICSQLSALGAQNPRRVLNGADPEIFAPSGRAEAREALRLRKGPVVAFIGDITDYKGIPELIAATRMISDICPTLLLAGSGPLERDAKAALDRIESVTARFFGTVPQQIVATIIAAADVVVLPSRREGLPTVLCEAMLSGRAVVASDVGGVAELVRSGQSGFTVTAGDPAQLAARIREVLTSPDLRLRFETEARQFAIANLTWGANASQYVAIYDDALAQRSFTGSER